MGYKNKKDKGGQTSQVVTQQKCSHINKQEHMHKRKKLQDRHYNEGDYAQ